MWKSKSYARRLGKLLTVLVVLLGILMQPHTILALKESSLSTPPLKAYTLADFQENIVRIYVANEDGSNSREVASEPITRFPPHFEVLMALSPSYDTLIYVTADNKQLHNAQIWKVSLIDETKYLLAQFTDELWVAPPVWSPSGEWIAYMRVTSTGKLKLWYMDMEGKHYSPLPEVEFDADSFYGNGNEIFRWTDDWHIQLPSVNRREFHIVNIHSGNIQVTSSVNQRQLAQLTVPVFSQNDPAWHNDVMQTCGLTIGNAGCAVTSSAMIFKYYGTNTNPRTLNNCLGNSACPIVWGTAASSCSEGKATYEGRPGFNYTTLESELNNGYPVIVWISNSACDANVFTHFVVATDGSGSSSGNYSMNDPWDGSSNRTLAYYTNQGYYLCSLRLFHGTPYDNCCGCGTQMACNRTITPFTSTILHNSSLLSVVSTSYPTISPTLPGVITPTRIPTEIAPQGYPESFSLSQTSDTVSLTMQIEPQIERVYTDELFIEEDVENLPQTQNLERKLGYFSLRVNLARPTSSGYYLARSVVAMGGGVKTSGSYQVLGTSGQTNDAGHLKSTNYTVNSGFWPGVISKSFNIYLPLVLRSG